MHWVKELLSGIEAMKAYAFSPPFFCPLYSTDISYLSKNLGNEMQKTMQN